MSVRNGLSGTDCAPAPVWLATALLLKMKLGEIDITRSIVGEQVSSLTVDVVQESKAIQKLSCLAG
jgi:hypothetical protein